ncbi:MAG: hypothetical protein JSU87_11065 [Gemmatimonadota bacterium]|nr:MAG: hypothetical protein JSU87_11065 [Gemmatimonadota bacterium]
MRRRSTILMALIAAALGVTALLSGCQSGGEYADLDVRSFKLQYIEPSAAQRIIDPYVFADRGGMISYDEQEGLITVRETPEMLARIEEVLQRYDKPEPSVKMHFRIIEADGQSVTPDPDLLEVEQALRDVFRFQNYRQVAEAVMTGLEWSEFQQSVASKGGITAAGSRYIIDGRVGEVRVAEGEGTVQLEVALLHTQFGPAFKTSVNARAGQLLILGSAQVSPDAGALILAVEVELLEP